MKSQQEAKGGVCGKDSGTGEGVREAKEGPGDKVQPHTLRLELKCKGSLPWNRSRARGQENEPRRGPDGPAGNQEC